MSVLLCPLGGSRLLLKCSKAVVDTLTSVLSSTSLLNIDLRDWKLCMVLFGLSCRLFLFLAVWLEIVDWQCELCFWLPSLKTIFCSPYFMFITSKQNHSDSWMNPLGVSDVSLPSLNADAKITSASKDGLVFIIIVKCTVLFQLDMHAKKKITLNVSCETSTRHLTWQQFQMNLFFTLLLIISHMTFAQHFLRSYQIQYVLSFTALKDESVRQSTIRPTNWTLMHVKWSSLNTIPMMSFVTNGIKMWGISLNRIWYK